MKIEAGKEYRTRKGLKARIYATDGITRYPIHGATLDAAGWTSTTWTETGDYQHGISSNPCDLVAEWSDVPEFDWSNVPLWITHITMDSDGGWWGFDVKPVLKRGQSQWFCRDEGQVTFRIPSRFEPTPAPKDWKKSLLTRP